MAKQSLYGSKQEETLPAIPMGSGLSTVKPPEKQSFGNYVAFMHRDKGKWGDFSQKIPGLMDGDAVLVENGEPRKLAPVQFFLLDAFQYWSVADAEFKPRKAWTQKPVESTYQNQRINETLSVAVLILDQGRLIPASIRFTSGMCQGAHEAVRTATQDATSSEWAARGPDFKATLSIPQPNLRFKVELTWRPKKGRSGFVYFVSSARIIPTSAGDASLFGTLTKDEAIKEQLNLASEAFAEHRQSILSLV